MADRSLTATPKGIEQAKLALKGLQLNQQKLADRLNVTRQPIGKFFRGETVSNEILIRICEVLKLDWQVIAGIQRTSNPEPLAELEPEDSADIDELVQHTRETLRPWIQKQCGTMRVLDMDQPIELTGKGGIYTNVNILEKLTRLRSEKELLADCDVEVFDDRFGLGRSMKRLPGLVAVEQHRRLMVLGKPGAGKTTFLKYLAMQCITGGFAVNMVPLFVTLKDFAEAPKSPSLMEYLASLVKLVKYRDCVPAALVEQLLESGRMLVLLDGLDEVRQEDTARVNREMREMAGRFEDSQFVITCRIAAKEYVFERFTEVEVADFDEDQIATFAENWFRVKEDLPKAKTFVERLKENKPIQELASSPLLLTLLCLVFGDGNDFPSNRADLYDEGVKILLKKWDAKRNIQRDQLYKKLDVQRREDLLSYVALQSFEQKEYFVKQRRLEGYISDFIGNLRDVDPDPESLRVDSEAVLKSIQAQHGLLIERARGIYSFSHLTFQEYFAAREISATNQIEIMLSNIADKRWREVFLLTVGMMRNADELLLIMKKHIDLKLKSDCKIQHFLQVIFQKFQSVETLYTPFVVRDFYFNLACILDDIDYVRAHDLALDLDLALTRTLHRIHDGDVALVLARALDLTLKRELHKLFDLLPDISSKNYEKLEEWREDLRQVMIAHRNIGHDWQFTDKQKQLLQQYYDSNLLLVQCLNSDCYVSRRVREEIEETLLLPVEELEKLRMKNGEC